MPLRSRDFFERWGTSNGLFRPASGISRLAGPGVGAAQSSICVSTCADLYSTMADEYTNYVLDRESVYNIICRIIITPLTDPQRSPLSAIYFLYIASKKTLKNRPHDKL